MLTTTILSISVPVMGHACVMAATLSMPRPRHSGALDVDYKVQKRFARLFRAVVGL
jgi:hypothetical protein